MASCLVPDFPAVMMALEHLGELDKQLKEEKVPFSSDASHHLKEIAAAVTKLEAARRSVHEQLEVETIENGKVRHQIHKTRDQISQEIMTDVTAARESNAREIEALHADMNSISERHKTIVNRQEELVRQNTLLYPEREQLKATHERDMAAFNQQISLKLSRQARLQQTLAKVEELKITHAAVEHDRTRLEGNMAREREAFDVTKNSLLGEMSQAAKKALQQTQENARKKKMLDKSTARQLDQDERLVELTQRSALLEGAVERLAACRGHHEQELRDAADRWRDVVGQLESSERELGELRQHYETTTQRFQEDLILVDHDLDEGASASGVHQESLAHVTERFKAQRREEDEARALHLSASHRLERSTLRLEEQRASIVRHRREAREMEEEIGRLLEDDVLNATLFQEGQEKLHRRLEAEQRNLDGAEEEKGQLACLLLGVKREQEAYVAQATTNISDARQRYQELWQEEVTLRRSLSSSDEADSLSAQLNQAELDFVQMEGAYHGEMERLARDTEHVLRESEAKKRELEEREARLGEVEARYNQEESTLQRLERLTAGLKRDKAHLQQATEELRENTSTLLRPREEMKAELEEARAHHRDLLVNQASELTEVEAAIGHSGRKLDRVSVENSRMHLSILRMREDIAHARKDQERHGERMVALREEERTLLERVLQGWREDMLAVRGGRDGSRHLLEAFGVVLGQLENRSGQFASVTALVQQQLVHISKIGY